MKNGARFQKGSGCYKCESCGRMTRATGRGDNEHVNLCADCYDEGGLENQHSDEGHAGPFATCTLCHGVRS